MGLPRPAGAVEAAAGSRLGAGAGVGAAPGVVPPSPRTRRPRVSSPFLALGAFRRSGAAAGAGPAAPAAAAME